MLPLRLILAAGRRLAAGGALATVEDVFYLRADELLAALRGTLADPRSAVAAHKRAIAHWGTVTPPAFIGAPPAQRDDTTTLPSGGEHAHELAGNGTSAGVARGPARIMTTLAEADRLRPGDVLVARTTMPAWTPLFAVACAIVTENGGVLSHAAVVAREYGIPAVLGVKGATTLLKDGQLIDVDGANGTVRVVG